MDKKSNFAQSQKVTKDVLVKMIDQLNQDQLGEILQGKAVISITFDPVKKSLNCQTYKLQKDV